MMKIIKPILIYTPVFLIVLLNVLKWHWPDYKLEIFFTLALFCLFLGIALLIFSHLKYKVKNNSVGATILSLLAMQNVSGIALIVVMGLAFSWLIEYIRELSEMDHIPHQSLEGAGFSLFLIFLIVSIVLLIEKEKLSKITFCDPVNPIKTKGLVITLSIFSALENFSELIETLTFDKKKFLAYFKIVQSYKSKENLDEMRKEFPLDSNGEKLYEFFRLLAKSQLYPALIAVVYHIPKLKQVWILLSDEAKAKTLPLFLMLCDKAIPGWDKIKIKEVPLRYKENVKHVSMVVNSIYYNLNEEKELGEQEITADITGGLASITAGIILACVRSKRRVQYLSQIDFKLKAINVNVASIPHLFDEMVEQIEVMKARENSI